MIYWGEVKKQLLIHCPKEATNENWPLKEVLLHLNKTERLSIKDIAKLTRGRCGRTSLCQMMKRLQSGT